MVTTQTTSRRSGRALGALGLALVIAGLAVLGYVAWQYWGTTWLAKKEHESLRTTIVQDWDRGDDATEIKGEGLLRVPRFGADYEVPILLGFDDPTFAKGIGMYPEGAKPGEVGNLVLAAHRVTHGEPFRHFFDLKAGDDIIVETRTEIFTYRLRDNGDATRVDFRTTWPLQPVPSPDAAGVEPTEKLVTLLTCSELFHTDDRSVAVGELVDVQTKSDAG
ncbi:class E sortase [Aeromicrobium piscarium]|uniref:Class E sortase n=1 Tax=Aeromicrobium piscarium TaxID=2590901 RepID=A0A554RNX9_9ACTN|nr:sortase [Aeromicrobium sp. YIM 150415]TSD55815.1 class E sortase [Aeromicrobium piscarium]